jgi:hypothetical protein
VNNKFYVGMHSTFNLEDDYLGSGKRLWYSIQKYGKKNHRKEILEFCKDRIELKKREKEIVNETFIKDPMCMNLITGGDGGLPPFKNKREERKWHIKGAIAANKIRTERLRKKLKEDKNFRDKMSISWSKGQTKRFETQDNPMLGKTHSKEAREKISIGQTGKRNSQFGTMWITNGKENKKILKSNKLPQGWFRGRENIMDNKISELNSLHGQSKITREKIDQIVDQLQTNSSSYNFKYKYISPVAHGVEIITKDGTNKLFLDGEDINIIYSLLKRILEEPKQNTEKPKFKKEDPKV